MRYAAFFRNLNLGRANSPNREQFEAAFLEAGASEAKSFLTNGTIAFDASGIRSAKKILAAASESMGASCGLVEPAFLREMTYLAALVDTQPFESIDRDTVYDCYITFLHAKAVIPRGFPRVSPRGDVKFVQLTDSEVLSVSYKPGKTPGNPNAILEKELALPVTTRAWNTVVRLVGKHADL
jgi:uncharacterized protein (DUF1697 family)